MTILEFVRNIHPAVSVTLAVCGAASVGGSLIGCVMAGDDAREALIV